MNEEFNPAKTALDLNDFSENLNNNYDFFVSHLHEFDVNAIYELRDNFESVKKTYEYICIELGKDHPFTEGYRNTFVNIESVIEEIDKELVIRFKQ